MLTRLSLQDRRPGLHRNRRGDDSAAAGHVFSAARGFFQRKMGGSACIACCIPCFSDATHARCQFYRPGNRSRFAALAAAIYFSAPVGIFSGRNIAGSLLVGHAADAGRNRRSETCFGSWFSTPKTIDRKKWRSGEAEEVKGKKKTEENLIVKNIKWEENERINQMADNEPLILAEK
jgi:hypothetical protein